MDRIFITGANRGIGLELVRQYLGEDTSRIFATARQPQAAGELQALVAAHPGRLTLIPLEVTDEAAIAQAAQTVAGQVEALDILINNAAMNPPEDTQTLDGISVETMLRTLHVNTAAPLMIVKELLNWLRNGHNPRIINISSEMGSLAERTYGADYAYCASKAALNMVTRGLAADLRRDKITVIALDPGWVQTDMGSPEADLTPQESAHGIRAVAESLTLAQTGQFLRWDGQQNPW
ncbi:MAG: SDR family oxidoreductase [Anaerolineaceae bacterium]|nr:SDR family oxidoreductase [Anaerolineaceae bacterium]